MKLSLLVVGRKQKRSVNFEGPDFFEIMFPKRYRNEGLQDDKIIFM